MEIFSHIQPYITLEECELNTMLVDLQNDKSSCEDNGGTWISSYCRDESFGESENQ